MTRVRYKNVEGRLVSNSFLAGNDTVVVTIDPQYCVYRVDNSSGANLFTGTAETLSKAKSLAKTQLRSFGVVFSDEVRSRV